MIELLQSLFDAIKDFFGFFADIYQYIKSGFEMLFDTMHGVSALLQHLTGLPPMLLLVLTVTFTAGIIRLILNRR